MERDGVSLRNSQFPGFVQREQTTGRLGTDAKSHQCQDVSIGSPSLSSLVGAFSKMMEYTHCTDLLFCLVSGGLSSLSSIVGALSKMMEYTHCIDLCCFVLSSQGCQPCPLGGTVSKMMEYTHCIDLMLFCVVSTELSSLVGIFSKVLTGVNCIDLMLFCLHSACAMTAGQINYIVLVCHLRQHW